MVSPPRSDLVSAAMIIQGGQIPLEDGSTLRLNPKAGDYLLWIKCRNPWCNPPDFAIADFWEFREGDQLLITNCEQDYPATVEQMEGGPNLWKASPGDRLDWVGWRTYQPTLVALFNCLRERYVYGEPISPTLDSVIGFGAPTGEATAEVHSRWKIGYDAATIVGHNVNNFPRNTSGCPTAAAVASVPGLAGILANPYLPDAYGVLDNPKLGIPLST